ncbi:peptidase M16 [Trichosporon asahii var. asahii CBS 2479]|uniref:Cytochrome b-c1 complex subunit 2, mitochondrial n=1 Tax=Trichosporon asahii var. asahii (strain ATCC 90039 / CBS 2479 / JCM 2466 / KCTC 7840 / NBRC 103889/ NCYC 2677 / UAMH 7654) TaxID=1186058 RepID=J5TTF0_TRIAS|nr:peptidase M16 [Trichosporon asahii var. asahii CBS 2479]EJT52726.1 peptidase M16 [Trichosporon asahii var. asahii CBS 2479]
MSFLRARAAPALRRSYATAAGPVEAAGVKVLGIENGLRPATSSVTIVVKGGSRYEPAVGTAHVLKNFAFKTTAEGSALKNVRKTELYGGVLSSGLGREHLYLNAENVFVPLLASVLSSTQFLPWEYSELVLPNVQGEAQAAAACPIAAGIDAAHAVAFRRGLGNSIYASPNSPVTLDNVKQFAQAAFAKNNIAVIGQGISTEALASAVQQSFGSGSAAGGNLSTSPSQYFGGEERLPLDTHSNPSAKPTLVIAYGQQGAETPELAVLPHLLGGESALKWVPGTSPLSKAAAKVPGAQVRSFTTGYSDAALFNIVIQAPTNEGVRSVAQEVAQAIKATSNISEEEFSRAIAKARFAEATKLDTAESLIVSTANAVLAGQAPKPHALESLSASAVSKAAGELFKAKPTVVAIGNTHVLPYADELGL